MILLYVQVFFYRHSYDEVSAICHDYECLHYINRLSNITLSNVTIKNTMKITLATHHHLSVLIELDSYAQQNSSRIEEIKAWLSSQAIYLIEVNAEVVGYGVIHSHFFGYPFIELVMIAHDQRGKGYGKALILFFQEQLTTEKLFTSTNQSNTKMKNLLLQLGFIKSGCIENLDEDDPEVIFCFIQ